MMKFVILFAFVAFAAASPTSRLNTLNPSGRIIGGEDTTIENIPYQVSLQVFGSHSCGGSIISEYWILSAAHCMIYPISWFTVRSGSTLSNSGGVLTAVEEGIDHAGYSSSSFGVPIHDITLLRLRSPLTFGSTQAPINLYRTGQEAEVDALSVVTGWGLTSEGGSTATILQTVTLPIISKEDCNSAYSSLGGISEGQICAGFPEGGRDACLGDSGGPLAIDGVLAGVVSWGAGCARAGWPGAYTEVASYRTWITENSGV